MHFINASSKVIKQHYIKKTLFEKLKNKGLFWSYSKELSYEQLGDDALCEIVLKYAGFDDIKLAYNVFGLKMLKRVLKLLKL